MRTLLFAALCGLAFASVYRQHDEYESNVYDMVQRREIEDNSFQPGREYRYFYDGQVLNGIPRSSKQHSGTRIQAVVIVQLPAQDKIVLKLENIRFGKINRKVSNPRAELPFRAFEHVEIKPELLQKLELPIGARYIQGVVEDVQFEPTEEAWSANIKRAVLNLLQVNMKKQHSTDDLALTNEASVATPMTGKAFRTNEKTLEGDCDVIYAITEQPANPAFPVMNVTKAVNLEQCSKRRPVLKYNWRLASECPSCDQKYQSPDKFVKSSTIVKLNITGTPESFMIESAKAESQYSVLMYNEAGSYLNSYVNATLRLFKTGPKTASIRMPTTPAEHGLSYSLSWDLLKEKFFTEGDELFHQRSPYSKVPNKPALILELIKELTTMHEEVDGPVSLDAPRLFTQLVRMLRMCTKEELRAVHDSLFAGQPSGLNPEQVKYVRDILPNAIGLCGTRSCIKHLIERIENQEFSQIKAAAALRQLQSARIVSKEAVKELMELCQKPVIERSFVTKQACYLSLGSLIRSACEPEEDRLALDSENAKTRCPLSFKQEFVQFITSKLESTEAWENKILYLKSLSNAALDVSILKLEKIIQNIDRVYPTYIRSEAIVALRHLKSKMPKKVQKICLPVFMNIREPVQVRSTAAYMLLSSMPERPVLEMIAKQADIDRSEQVASFVYSYLSTLANSTNPCYKKLSADAKLAMRFTRKVPRGLQYSKYLHLPIHSQIAKLGLDFEPFLAFSNRSAVPRNVGLNLNTNIFGFFTKDLLTVAATMEGFEPTMAKFFGPEGALYKVYSAYMRHPRDVSAEKDFTPEIQEIVNKLNIQERNPYSAEHAKEPKAYLYFRWLGQELGFVPFSAEHISYMMENGADHIRDFHRALTQGKNFNVHYATILSESEIKIPTALGLPLVVRHEVPVVMKTRGQIKIVTEPQGSLMAARKIQIHADLKPSVVIKAIQRVELWSPIVKSGLKIKAIARVFTPIKAKLDLDYSQSPSQLKLQIEPPTKERDILHLETVPISFVKVWPSHVSTLQMPEEKVIPAEEVKRVQEIRKSYPGQLLGVATEIYARYTPKTNSPMWVPMCPLSGPNVLKVRVAPGTSRPQMIEIKTVAGLLNHLSEPIRSSLLQRLQSASSSDSLSSEDFEEYQSQVHRNSEMQVQVSTIGDSQPRMYRLKLANKFTDDLRHGKLDLKLYSSPIPGVKSVPTEICLNAEIAYPQVPFRMSEIDGKKVVSHAEITWGQSCNPSNSIKILTQAERSMKQVKYERENLREYHNCKSFGEQSPIECFEYLKEAGRLTKFDIDIQYVNVPTAVKNLTAKAMQAIKYYYYPQTDVAFSFDPEVKQRNEPNKIHATIRVDPANRRLFNATVRTPKETLRMTDAYAPLPIAPINVKRSALKDSVDFWSAPIGFQPKCKLTPRRLQTFDNAQVSLPLGTCWTVLAKDCSASKRFVVQAKLVSPNAPEKKVKIITPRHKVILDGSNPEDIKVKVNGAPVQPTEFAVTEYGAKVVKVFKYGPYVKVYVPQEGLWVFFDGQSVEIKIPQSFVGRQCGLCGHFDYERSDEWRSASMEPISDIRQVLREFTIKDSSCKLPESICEDESCSYRPSYDLPSSSAEYDVPRDFDHTKTVPIKLNKVIRKYNKICISQEPIEKCPEYAVPKSASEKEISYACFPSSNIRGVQLAAQARVSPVPELKSEPTAFTQRETVEIACRRY